MGNFVYIFCYEPWKSSIWNFIVITSSIVDSLPSFLQIAVWVITQIIIEINSFSLLSDLPVVIEGAVLVLVDKTASSIERASVVVKRIQLILRLLSIVYSCTSKVLILRAASIRRRIYH